MMRCNLKLAGLHFQVVGVHNESGELACLVEARPVAKRAAKALLPKLLEAATAY